jgi:hypothetical protein
MREEVKVDGRFLLVLDGALNNYYAQIPVRIYTLVLQDI